MLKTTKYEFGKPEQNDFYDINVHNNNMDEIERALTEFDDSGKAEGITSFTDMFTKLATGNKLAVTLRNLKAGLQFCLHVGSIVNNCVTDNARLPLSAAQGKVLMDAVTKLNSDLPISGSFREKKHGDYIEIGHAVSTNSIVFVFPSYNTSSTIRCNFSIVQISAGRNTFQLSAWDTHTNDNSASTTLAGCYIILPV